MQHKLFITLFLAVLAFNACIANAQTDSACMRVTLTGTGTPPATERGGPGVLVTYGLKSRNCGATTSTSTGNDPADGVRLQFDVGRSTTQSMTKYAKTTPSILSALFITHIHSDHVIGLSDVLHNRWLSTKADTGSNAFVPLPVYVPKFANETGSGTIGQMVDHVLDGLRSPSSVVAGEYYTENEIRLRQIQDNRNADPRANVQPFLFSETAVETGYSKTFTNSILAGTGDVTGVTVQAIAVDHLANANPSPCVGYRVTTPVGVVTISGDTTVLKDRFGLSFSANADIIVHSIALQSVRNEILNRATICATPTSTQCRNALALYDRQASGELIGDMAASLRTPFVMLTHLFNVPGQAGTQGLNYLGGPIRETNYSDSLLAGGYPTTNSFGDRTVGRVVVGRDGAMIEIPTKTISIPDQPCSLWWMTISNTYYSFVNGPVNHTVFVRCGAGNIVSCPYSTQQGNRYVCSGQACHAPRTMLITPNPLTFMDQTVECRADPVPVVTQESVCDGITFSGSSYSFTVTGQPSPRIEVTCASGNSAGNTVICPWVNSGVYQCLPNFACVPTSVRISGFEGPGFTCAVTSPWSAKRSLVSEGDF